jgi:hypothetical protein
MVKKDGEKLPKDQRKPTKPTAQKKAVKKEEKKDEKA